MAEKKKRGAKTTRMARKGAAGSKKPAPLPESASLAKRLATKAKPDPDRARAAAAEQMWLTKPSRARVGKEVVALRDQIARDRAGRHAEYLQHMDNLMEPPFALAKERGIDTLRALTPTIGKRPLRILAEGDSWFDYPLPWPEGDGVITQLQDLLGYPIDNMAHWGEQLRQMMALDQRREIARRLQEGIRYDVMLFSGGGNDLAGDGQFVTWLKDQGPVSPPDQMFNDDALDAEIKLLEAQYKELIAIRDQYSPGTIIFVNCYDFPKITGKGVCTLGPWLKPSLDYVYEQMGVMSPDPGQEFLVVKALLQKFSQMLRTLASNSANQLRAVPTQGTLEPDVDWQNEIHPTTAGFVKIARQFQAELSAAFQ
jgi:hypothetical protein